MQNMYVGDIGDYGKYGLLRAIMPSVSKLGIVWYLVADENHLNDGKHIDYLSKLKYIDCDRQLFSILKDIISLGKRSISKIEQSSIFPTHTTYYSDYLTYDGIKANTPTGRAKRAVRREQWLGNALETVHDCDAVFLDPDNGLETTSVLRHHAKAPKYVYYDEIMKFLSVTNTLIIYHHLNRNGDHITQIKENQKLLQELAGNRYTIISLRFRPYSPRAYFIITNQEQVRAKLDEFVNSNWKQCFELVE
jgi:hypothetical protein